MIPLLTTAPREAPSRTTPGSASEHLPMDVAIDLAWVETALVERLASDIPVAMDIGRQAVRAGGKRVRPIVSLLFARALGAPVDRSRELALVVEWVHVASLLHDDVIDRAEQRRGQPAAHVIHGEHAAIMTGDYLLARAIQQLLLRGDPDGAGGALGEAVALLAEGEILEAGLRGRLDATPQDLEAVAYRKTSSLLAWAARAGAQAAHASPGACAQAARYGAQLGLAFQYADDALDYAADARTGKDRLADLRAGLPTLPLLHAFAHDPGLRSQVARYLEAPAPDVARAIATRVRAAGGVAAARAAAREAARSAVRALACLPAGAHRSALARLARYVARRDR